MTSDSTGIADAEFAPVRASFDAMLDEHPGFSAQIAVIWRGKTVIDLTGGPGLDADALTGVFSVTKGVAALVIGLLLDRERLRLDEPVATYWPQFAAADKAAVTVRQLLAHRAGVLGVDDTLSVSELVDSGLAAERLAATFPVWQPDSAHGYHAITIGVLMEELVRRATGRRLQDIYEEEIRAPRSLDFYLGLPDSLENRYRPVGAAVPPDGASAETPPSTDGIQSLAFNALHSTLDMVDGPVSPNNPAVRAAGIAAVGGVGSARGLAGVYASVLDTEHPLLTAHTVERMSQQQSFGIDRVLGMTTAFGITFMKPHPAMDFGSYRAFGHDGAGGALGFADPLHDLAFGYIPHPMQLPGGADPRAVTLSQQVRRIIRSLDQRE